MGVCSTKNQICGKEEELSNHLKLSCVPAGMLYYEALDNWKASELDVAREGNGDLQGFHMILRKEKKHRRQKSLKTRRRTCKLRIGNKVYKKLITTKKKSQGTSDKVKR